MNPEDYHRGKYVWTEADVTWEDGDLTVQAHHDEDEPSPEDPEEVSRGAEEH